MVKMILASASPRRRELLSAMGYSFELLSCDVDETVTDVSASEHAAVVAARKADEAERLCRGREYSVIITADTTVCIDDMVLGKPDSTQDAARMLRKLSGRTHDVRTALCLLCPDGHRVTGCELTRVTFRALSESEIQEYIAGGEPMDKAGAYGIQGDGGSFVESCDGEYDNVVGLPGKLLRRMLEEAKKGRGCL